MNIKYCDVCGLELIEKEGNMFDRETGKKILVLVCSSGKCGHYGIPHEYVAKKGIFNSLIGVEICIHCGREITW